MTTPKPRSKARAAKAAADPDDAKAGQERRAKPRAYLPAAERRRLIIAAAQRVFARSNLKGARTRDIDAEAEVNQATVFEHFASKEALFEAAVLQPLIDVMEGMQQRRETYEAATNPDELADLALVSGRRHVADIDAVFPLMAAALFSERDKGQAFYRDHLAPLIRARGRILDGLTREGLDLDFVGLANFGILFAIALDRHFGGEELGTADCDDLARQFIRMATGGFARRPAPADNHEKEDDHGT
mgnify:FL=1